MKKLFYLFLAITTVTVFSGIFSCQQPCLTTVFLETLSIDFQPNSDNLGLLTGAIRNSGDTIKSLTNQFYNYPEFRRFGDAKMSAPSLFINSAYAGGDCLEKQSYYSRMDLSKSRFSISLIYDGSAVGVGSIPADSNLLSVPEIKEAFLTDFDTNVFLKVGGSGPLTINPNFFEPINDQYVTFYFYLEEENGQEFEDSLVAYIKVL